MKIRRSLFVFRISLLFLIISLGGRFAYARMVAEDLPAVEKLFMEGKYERVVQESTKLIDAGAYGREELFYLKGLSQMQMTDFSQSRETFRYMAERYPRGKRAFDGYIGIGDAYFLEGKAAEAVTSYNEALNNFPDHKNIPIVYYKLGNAYQKLGNSQKAAEYFDKVKKTAPLSFESRMASGAAIYAPPQEAADADTCEPTDYFYVQAGYFRSRINAEKMNAALKRKGYDGYLSVQKKGGLTFYRVKVGRFKVKSDAEDLARRMKADGFKTKVCR